MNALTVQVRFEYNPKPYMFYTDIADLAEGDRVVVRASTGLQVANVLSAPKDNSALRDKANAWVLCRVDFSSEIKRQKRAEIEKELKRAIEETSVLERAKQLADFNPALAGLIAQLEEMDK